jgi:hypothetical protein
MKLTLEFDTSTEEDDLSTIRVYMAAPEMHGAIHEADDILRGFYKHEDYDDKTEKMIERAREALNVWRWE